MHVCVFSHFSPVHLFVTLWIVAHQTPQSMGFSRQEPPGDFPNPGIESASPESPVLQADSLLLTTGEACGLYTGWWKWKRMEKITLIAIISYKAVSCMKTFKIKM